MKAHTLILLAALIFGPVSVYAAESHSAEMRYDEVKEQAQSSASVGIHKRHKAYRDHVMEARKHDAEGVSTLEPAAGEESEKPQDKSEAKLQKPD